MYHSWRNKKSKYKDIVGLCKSVQVSDIEKQGWVLTPGRYVEIKEDVEDTVTFDIKMKKLTRELTVQFQTSQKLEKEVKKNLEKIGFEI